MLLTYLSYVGVFFLGFILAAVFHTDKNGDPVDLGESFERLRNGCATEADNEALLEAAQFDRDGKRFDGQRD